MRDCLVLAPTGVAALLILSSCNPAPGDSKSETDASAATAFAWPPELPIFGDGFPKAGDPCRKVGESQITAKYLDDSAQLVGCPGSVTEAASVAIVYGFGGRVIGTVEGAGNQVTLISVPLRDANVGMNTVRDDDA